MDLEGVELLIKKDPEQFKKYLQKTENTICGRHPLMILN